jgi:hypothetical protein
MKVGLEHDDAGLLSSSGSSAPGVGVQGSDRAERFLSGRGFMAAGRARSYGLFVGTFATEALVRRFLHLRVL